MSKENKKVHVVGAGLAGSECAFQLAEMGYQVHLIEMKGQKMTPAHKTEHFAELVCSNSLGSTTDYSAPGQLKHEAKKLNSLILNAAHEASVPAGMALGVDREIFSKNITLAIENHPNILIERKVVHSLNDIPRPAVIATGPLTEESLAESMRQHFDDNFLYFFDAIAPIIDAETIDMDIAWKADRWDKGTKDYINCPLDKEQYYHLINEIKQARKVVPKEFELNTPYFEACMPIEEMIERGNETLRFGPLSPKGLINPRTGRRAYAVVQLRQENKEATAYNMVGFQTKMAYPEQKRILAMIPGLEQAEFLKLGSIHRNLYIHSPQKLNPDLSSKKDPWLFFAGQITGVEGYFESTCIGLLVAHLLSDKLENRPQSFPPRASAFGSLLNALVEEKEHFQPTNINFSLFPKLGATMDISKMGRAQRREEILRRARASFDEWLAKNISSFHCH